MAENTHGKPNEFGTVIGPDAQFKGELSFEGGVRVDGRFEGSIKTSGQVLISKGGEVKADVQARHLMLEGRLEGNLEAQDLVELRATANLQGDVRAAKLLVVEGATLVGRCEVGPNVSATTPATPGTRKTSETPSARQQIAAAAAPVK